MDDLPRVRAWRAAREGMPEPVGDGDYAFAGEIGDFPEEWVERTDKGERLRSSLRKFAPRSVQVDATGALGGSGRHGWLIPGKFRFCPSCRQQSSSRAREINKLAGLSGEGRSSATTLLVSSTLRWMNEAENGIAEGKRKLLGFTDNRQDAALQSGHFNDFLFVTLLRAAILAAVRSAGRRARGGRYSAGRISFGSASSPERCQAAGVECRPRDEGVHVKDAERALGKVRAIVSGPTAGGCASPTRTSRARLVPPLSGAVRLAADDDAFAGGAHELATLSARNAARRWACSARICGRDLAARPRPGTGELKRWRGSRASCCASLGRSRNARTCASATTLMIDRAEAAGNQFAQRGLIERAVAEPARQELNRADIWGSRLRPTATATCSPACCARPKATPSIRPLATVFGTKRGASRRQAVRLFRGGPESREAGELLFRSISTHISRMRSVAPARDCSGLEKPRAHRPGRSGAAGVARNGASASKRTIGSSSTRTAKAAHALDRTAPCRRCSVAHHGARRRHPALNTSNCATSGDAANYAQRSARRALGQAARSSPAAPRKARTTSINSSAAPTCGRHREGGAGPSQTDL